MDDWSHNPLDCQYFKARKRMPLKFAQRKAEEVPSASSTGKVNLDLLALKNEMAKLSAGMVLEIETESEKAVRGTKMLITKASRELGAEWQHWSVGATVFTRPLEGQKRRGRPKKAG